MSELRTSTTSYQVITGITAYSFVSYQAARELFGGLRAAELVLRTVSLSGETLTRETLDEKGKVS